MFGSPLEPVVQLIGTAANNLVYIYVNLPISFNCLLHAYQIYLEFKRQDLQPRVCSLDSLMYFCRLFLGRRVTSVATKFLIASCLFSCKLYILLKLVPYFLKLDFEISFFDLVVILFITYTFSNNTLSTVINNIFLGG